MSLPFSSGSTLPTALAAPVDEGMMFAEAALPPRQSCEARHEMLNSLSMTLLLIDPCLLKLLLPQRELHVFHQPVTPT